MLKYQLFNVADFVKANIQYLKGWVSCYSLLQVHQMAVWCVQLLQTTAKQTPLIAVTESVITEQFVMSQPKTG